ncbi:zinc ribbon domain-containing protein [Bacillus cytotoxicus]|uniref:Zinc-ribbon domain-containing protein n=2 Tax=Bacillus cytotoxicus TaxID=580165 RepID=A0AAX2CE18_9BACI|nr:MULTISPECIES: zinc ribbon domain-containing protein [Bacillus cereus group]ABS21285.1 conserved hypothetical protein [Bacillus cytotoxicus NVH 391-98]AWC27928.1 zinc ribbon domain-containing protein [Bacillus cytotoxicus]AWC31976.1 zinc ribbon domain-containing protein [Bacillus cytotoxicus]AWC36009.1 zinc ribbon domain-containing protein [Bacillus cytotoxicus]AWC40690.1 zinc ribbon domain-containing protein [Bacillus cytotoxicus]
MTCPNCHMENTAHAKFCGYCGHALTELAEEQAGRNDNLEKRTNEVREQVKEFVSGYFHFFKNAMKAPSAIMKSGSIEGRNGITSLIFICFLFTLVFYRIMNETTWMTMSLMPETPSPSLLGESIKIFFFLLVLFLFIGFIIFISGKLMQSSFSFWETLGVWGTVATPVVTMLILSFLFSFLTIFLTMLFLGMAVTLMDVGIIVSIFRLDRGGLDPVYTLIIANILIFIAGWLVFWSYLKIIVHLLTGL